MPSVSDPSSIDHLYRDHHDWLRRWLCRRLDCSAAAADLAHDTFVRVLVSNRLPTTSAGEPRALLTHIARGLVIDHWRRQTVERAYLETLAHMPAHAAPSAETRALIIEALTRMDDMLSSMPARVREIFLLAQLDGLTLKQISQRTNTPLITVRRYIRRAMLACMTQGHVCAGD